ncbi:hypothetical protein AVEN_24237-1 [Araneus ventricosus]|uniref:Uncharacterized protein n=1 Tax=Araneus ventricosus TaxID=182803 RepID=A0A4Y2G345_ARAVE|nr:hypothetical protein AVEN_24237-1 [Araneus ventricosus]
MSLWVRCRPQSRTVPGLRPDSTEDPSCIGPVARYIIRKGSNVQPLLWFGNLERGCHLRCRPHDLTAVQYEEVHPKMALVLLQNGVLI